MAEFLHPTGTDGQMAQSWEASSAPHTAPACGHGYPSTLLSCPRRWGRGHGCSGGVTRNLTGLSFMFRIHMEQRTPATTTPSLLSGHPGALGLASVTPQQRSRAWTLFPCQRATGSQSLEQAPCCLAPARIRVGPKPPLSPSPTTAVPAQRPTDILVCGVCPKS